MNKFAISLLSPLRISFLMCALLAPFQIFAAGAPTAQDYSIHQHFVAPRALAMGNTFSGVDDYNAIFYNPAALAQFKEGQLNFGIQGGAHPNLPTLVKNIQDASSATNSAVAIADVIEKEYGKIYGLRFPTVEALWARPGWGIALIPADLSLNAQFHQIVGPGITVSAYQDTTLAFSYAKTYMNNKLSVGATLKGIYRAYYGRDLLGADLLANSNFIRLEDAVEGFTLDADVAASYKLTPPTSGIFSFLKYAQPTFSAVVRNIADYGFKQKFGVYNKASTSVEPPILQRRLDIGSRWDLPEFWVFHPKFLFDVRDIGHEYWSFIKGLHLGADLAWDVSTWLRGNYSMGLSEGYVTGGAGFELGVFRLDLVTYAQEAGTKDVKLENRFYMLKASLIF